MVLRSHLRLSAGLGVLALLVLGSQTVAGLDVGLALLAPALVLLAPLLAGWYVGEERLARWRTAFTPRRRRAAVRLVPRLRRVARTPSVSAGAQIAAALGRRGPPPARPLAV
jgi:hypothetical protein